MSVNLRLPYITGTTSQEQLTQLKSYLHQLVGELQWALDTVNTSGSSVVTQVSVSQQGRATEKPVVDSQATFNAIKGLIIKSADIVEAFYEEINRQLVGEYVAISDFGEFKETTIQDISENSTSITNHYTNIQKLLTGIDNINFTLAEVNAYIKTGEIDKDQNGLPIYGVEIKQKTSTDGNETFSNLARFTAERLAFYDPNGSSKDPVAYISGDKLNIPSAVIEVSLTIGGFEDKVMDNGDVVTKWVGRR